MLSFLILFNMLAWDEVAAKEGFMPSPDTLANAIQQAQQIQKSTQELIKKHSINHNLGSLIPKKCCPFQSKLVKENANQRCKKNIEHEHPKIDNNSKILVFVSFSMPETSLKSLFQEAQKHNAVLIMRGLYQDGFMQTAQKLQDLSVTIDINPELFEAHNITSVPTFVLLRNSYPNHSLKGNITLDFAIQKFKDQQFKESQPEGSQSEESKLKELVS